MPNGLRFFGACFGFGCPITPDSAAYLAKRPHYSLRNTGEKPWYSAASVSSRCAPNGNPGNGGCGGTLYQDGRDELTSLCGVTIRGGTAGAIGGALFRVSNDHTGRFAMDRTTIDNNRVTPTTNGNAGGLYLEGLALDISRSTISRNQSFFNGGIWINACSVQMTNSTIAENVAFGSNGGGIWLGNAPTGTNA